MTLSALLLNSTTPTLSITRIMLLVILACLPGTLALLVFFGWGYAFNILWLACLALLFEAAVLKLRGKPVAANLRDYSALVTALLLALTLPPTAPWWLGLVGVFFAIVIAKHLYGGLGYNPFNPAMVGYVVLLISFPLEMTRWLLPASAEQVLPGFAASAARFAGADPAVMDAFTGATILDQYKLARGGLTGAEFLDGNPLFGTLSGRGWEWVNAGFLLGGLYLVYRRIISWHIPVTILGSLTLLAALFYDGGSSAGLGSPWLHLFGGATMLGAFFIATDPVSAAATPRGKLVYGVLIGILIYCIRVWGTYPDGVAFAVLLGNFAAPTIDYFTRGETPAGNA